MEANICDVNHLDADVLLPPRKRLLAGFKKQASNGNGAWDQPTAASSSTSSPPSTSPFSATSSSDVDTHLNNLFSSRFNNLNLSPEEIFKASRSAAIAAAKAAESARVVAEEKAVIAAKAIAAAKCALDMVATFPEDACGTKDRYMKKNKLKKHVPVQVLYKRHQPIENFRVDEDLASRLHRAINSSPRISNDSSTSEWIAHQHKRPKSLPTLENTKASDGGILLGGSSSSTCNGGTTTVEIDSDGLVKEHVKPEAKVANYEKSGQSALDNSEAESGYSSGKKRGRVKLKKLPLSICSYRDRLNLKEEMITKGSPLMETNMGNPTVVVKPLFPSRTLC